MAKLKVEIIADIWDEDGDRVPKGTVLDLEHNIAAKFIKSGNAEIVVEEAPKRGRAAGPKPETPKPETDQSEDQEDGEND